MQEDEQTNVCIW